MYASSAAVYGLGPVFKEGREHEHPLNVYGYSKFLFDQFIRRALPDLRAPVIGLRYFNVYGPREAHKGRMASVAFHHVQQFRSRGRGQAVRRQPRLCRTASSGAISSTSTTSIATNLHFWDHPRSGIYNVGTGRAQAFNDVAKAVVNAIRAERGQACATLEQLVAAGEIRYVPFPEALRGKYQAFTQADRVDLEQAGMSAPVQDGRDRHGRVRAVAAGAGPVKAAAFLDRDGVVNIDRGYVFRREDFEFVPGTLDAARELKSMGLALVVVTNQSGIARGYYGPEQFHALTDWMKETFAAHGAALDGVYFCPHHPTEGEAPYRQDLPLPQAGARPAARCGARPRHRPAPFGAVRRQGERPAGGARGRRPATASCSAPTGARSRTTSFPGGLATERFRSLADAVRSDSMRALLARLPHEQAAA